MVLYTISITTASSRWQVDGMATEGSHSDKSQFCIEKMQDDERFRGLEEFILPGWPVIQKEQADVLLCEVSSRDWWISFRWKQSSVEWDLSPANVLTHNFNYCSLVRMIEKRKPMRIAVSTAVFLSTYPLLNKKINSFRYWLLTINCIFVRCSNISPFGI